jgi:hypothetical protein
LRKSAQARRAGSSPRRLKEQGEKEDGGGRGKEAGTKHYCKLKNENCKVQNYKISRGRKKKEGSWDQLTGNKEQR